VCYVLALNSFVTLRRVAAFLFCTFVNKKPLRLGVRCWGIGIVLLPRRYIDHRALVFSSFLMFSVVYIFVCFFLPIFISASCLNACVGFFGGSFPTNLPTYSIQATDRVRYTDSSNKCDDASGL